MTIPTPAEISNPTAAAPRWRRSWRPWLPALALAAGAGAFVVLGLAIDQYGLESDGWGYGILGVVFAFGVMFPLSVTLFTGLAGAVSRSPRAQRYADLAGAAVVVVCGLVALVTLTPMFADPYSGATAFAAGSVAIGACWVAAGVVTGWPKSNR